MSTLTQTIKLTSECHFGARVPPQEFGEVLRSIPLAVRQSIRMAFEGRSRGHGKRPSWLASASDIRFLGHDGGEQTTLYFEAPRLGDAASRLYDQGELWSTRPKPEDTGFDLLADVISDVAAKNPDSDRFDKPLLLSLTRFNKGIDGVFQRMEVTGHRYAPSSPAVLDKAVIHTAQQFSRTTPRAQQVRVMGRLDMIRASTASFALKLRDGDEIRGVLAEGEIGHLSGLFQKDVLILGKAIFRPSGRLLRIDAEEVLPASDADQFFSKSPVSQGRRIDLRDLHREHQQKRGIAAIFGKWPGDESDDQIDAALRQLS
jgi:hypothetical protein